jgi:hypothetical protein
MGRVPQQRTTAYGKPTEERRAAGRAVNAPLEPVRIDFRKPVASGICAA